MSEVASRAAATRGRSSVRGGRGRGRGAARTQDRQTNGNQKAPSDFDTDQGELGEMKKQYSQQLSMAKELFPGWTEVDLLFALQETDGDLDSTIDRISEGNISQFQDVEKKSKDRSRSKVKDSVAPSADNATSSTRPARGRGGLDVSRGGRGRGGSRGGRGAAHAAANGARGSGAAVSVPTNESTAWDTTGQAPTNTETPTWDTSATKDGAPGGKYKSVVTSSVTPVTASEGTKPSLVPGGTKMTWASIAKPKPAPAPPKPAAQAPAAADAAIPTEPEASVGYDEGRPELTGPDASSSAATDGAATEEPPATTIAPEVATETPSVDITPPKEPLTQENVEHIPDFSEPAPTGTAASTVASSATPSLTPQPPIGRPPVGGYAASAFKATGTPARSASFQRRILEQQEAVVMPGNHAVDRAAVQFGSMGLNGDVDSLDVDEDREEAETRTQPPQHSPPSQPRASLPPVPRQPPPPAETSSQDMQPTPKPAPGLPLPHTQQPGQQQSPSNPLAPQAMSQQGSQASQQYNQFGRYGQPLQETSAPAQKPYDPFGQQAQQTSFDSYPSHTQATSQPQQAPQVGGFSSAPSDYSSFYTSDQQRNAYQNFYGNYGQQNQQDAGASQPRTGSAFGSNPSGENATQGQQTQSRYGEASGQNTPNPALPGQHQSSTQSQQAHMPHGQGQHGAGYYGSHPYYQTPYYQHYMNQYSYGQQGFGGPFSGKSGMYGQPHHGYGMSPQSSYDQHSSSPANVGGFGASALHGRDSGLGGTPGEYGRSSSTQPSQSQQHGSTSGPFSGMQDTFGRSQGGLGGFAGQSQQYGQQQGNQQGASEDALKPFGDSKSAAGPSPSALGQPGRPGSATNPGSGQASQSGLPPPQSHQGFGGYPNHLSQQSQYGGLGGLGGHQAGSQNHQGGGYGQYGGTGFSNYGSYGRGGWGGNYGH